jgi:hypothetical protein
VIQTARMGRAKPLYRMYASLCRWNPPPRMLLNSYPKAGTHLLKEVATRLPSTMHSGVHIQSETLGFRGGRSMVDLDDSQKQKLRKLLGGVRDGQFATAHLGALRELRATLDALGFARILLVRDPRDVVVSYAMWVPKVPGHHLSRAFETDITAVDDRISAVIGGIAPTDCGPGLESIGERLRAYLPWMSDPRCLVVRFEDLVGPAGGGDRHAQIAAVSAVGRLFERPLSDDRAATLAAEIWNARSRTFRRGHVGDWRQFLSTEHKRLFKAVAGRELIELGYEKDMDW